MNNTNEASKLNIVNHHLQYKKVSLTEPSKHCYLHIAAEVDKSPFPFFITTSPKKKRLIKQCKLWCKQVEKERDVVSAVVFSARLIPPGKGKLITERKDKVHVAKFDVAILIEARTSEAINTIKNSEGYKKIELAIKTTSFFTHIITASNVRRINPVNHNKQGVFLFNYFFADNAAQNIGILEYTAGWFQQETGLDNSTVLLPTDETQSNYAIINHCRWNKMSDVLPSLLFKKSFHSYVLDNFYANKVAAIPVLYKLA